MSTEDPTVAGHAFKPREGEPWGLCRAVVNAGQICGMAQAAHADPGDPYVPSASYPDGRRFALDEDGETVVLTGPFKDAVIRDDEPHMDSGDGWG